MTIVARVRGLSGSQEKQLTGGSPSVTYINARPQTRTALPLPRLLVVPLEVCDRDAHDGGNFGAPFSPFGRADGTRIVRVSLRKQALYPSSSTRARRAELLRIGLT